MYIAGRHLQTRSAWQVHALDTHRPADSSRDPQGFRRRSELTIECPDQCPREKGGREQVCVHPANASAKETYVLDQAKDLLTLSYLCLGE